MRLDAADSLNLLDAVDQVRGAALIGGALSEPRLSTSWLALSRRRRGQPARRKDDNLHARIQDTALLSRGAQDS